MNKDPLQHPPPRKGLHLRGHRGHPEVRAALIRFAKWLRKNYEFPIRVPVYLSSRDILITMDGNKCTASFFAPFDREVEPYIRIATGDFPFLKAKNGRDNTLAWYICSLSHEIVHYQQWIETGETWERGVAVKAAGMLRRYELTTDHP